MRHLLSLELCRSLSVIPVGKGKLADINIKSFSCQRARRNSTIRSVKIPGFSMPLKEDDSVDGVEFIKASIVDILDDTIEEEG